jgi:TPR repeat protein
MTMQYYEESLVKNNRNYSAMCKLGDLYYPSDYKKAYDLYIVAAKNGYYYGQYNVGICYEYGHYVEKDRDTALVWYTLASSKNSPHIQTALGRMYEANGSLSRYWQSLAAEQGQVKGQTKLGL